MKWFWLAGVVLVLDQGSKWIADSLLGSHDVIPLLPFLALRKAYNPGAAFSFLSDASGWQRWFFVITSYSIHYTKLYDMRKPKSSLAMGGHLLFCAI